MNKPKEWWHWLTDHRDEVPLGEDLAKQIQEIARANQDLAAIMNNTAGSNNVAIGYKALGTPGFQAVPENYAPTVIPPELAKEPHVFDQDCPEKTAVLAAARLIDALLARPADPRFIVFIAQTGAFFNGRRWEKEAWAHSWREALTLLGFYGAHGGDPSSWY